MFPQGSACFSPKWIESHGNLLKVPCGHCPACLKTKQSSYELKTEIEASKFRYQYFITLTYHPYHLPLASLKKVFYKDVLNQDKYYYLIVSKLRRSKAYFQRRKLPHIKDGVVLGRVDINDKIDEKYLDMLSEKVKYNRKLPFLNIDDVQKFNKRCRKSISNISYEKIKILSCGEYGPISFRPHFHLLFMFNDPKIAKALYKIVRQAWTFGRIDVQASRGQCASYVAGYTTSNSNIPTFYRTCSLRPFLRTSKFFGSTIPEGKEKEVQQMLIKSTPYTRYVFNGRSIDVRLSWQDTNRLFPKVREYATTTPFERARRLLIFSELSRKYGLVSVTDIAKEHILHTKEYSRDTIEQLKRDLYLSKKYCKLYDFRSDLMSQAVKDYEAYFYRNDMEKLKNFYESQIKWYNITEDDKIYNLFYDNHRDMWKYAPTLDPFTRELDEFKWYREHRSYFITEYNNSIKHKKLNDLNKVFDYG